MKNMVFIGLISSKSFLALLLLTIFLYPAQAKVPSQHHLPDPKGSTASRFFSRLYVGVSLLSTWGLFEGNNPVYRNPETVSYIGTNPSREFDVSSPWDSRYEEVSLLVGVRNKFLSLGLSYRAQMVRPHQERFSLANSQYNIKISLPTTDILVSGLWLRTELKAYGQRTFSPYLSFSYPLSYTIKTLSYNSKAGAQVVDNNYLVFGLKVQDYEKDKLSGSIGPAIEAGIGIKVKSRLRVRVVFRAYKWSWNLFYIKHTHQVYLLGVSLGVY